MDGLSDSWDTGPRGLPETDLPVGWQFPIRLKSRKVAAEWKANLLTNYPEAETL